MEKQPHRTCEQTKTKQKTKTSQVRFTLTTRSIVQLRSQTMQWYH